MQYIIYILIYMYIAIGAIIGIELSLAKDKDGKKLIKKWYSKILFTLFKTFFWLPNIFADLIVNNIISNAERVKK